MNCLICGYVVINENNILKNMVTKFTREHDVLDLKHKWIKEWKMCLACSEKYSNEEIDVADRYLFSYGADLKHPIVSRIEQAQYEKQQQSQRVKQQQQVASERQIVQQYINDKKKSILSNEGEGGIRPPARLRAKKSDYEEAYIAYVEDGESAGVSFVRDQVEQVETKGKWIDVITLNVYEKFGRIGFNFVIVELFTRKIKPPYPEKLSTESDINYRDRIAYITWQTAHRDISEQRSNGVSGPKYLILSHLFNDNKGKTVKREVYWNAGKTVLSEKEKTKDRVQVTLPCTPKWKYDIRHVEKVTNAEINYINQNKYKIVGLINSQQRTLLEWFKPPAKLQKSKKQKRIVKN